METVKLAVCGTTCTMAIIMDEDIVIANVGDSRSILFCHKDLRNVSSGVASKVPILKRPVFLKVAGNCQKEVDGLVEVHRPTSASLTPSTLTKILNKRIKVLIKLKILHMMIHYYQNQFIIRQQTTSPVIQLKMNES